ncbi:MAG TPA: PDDEXK nuclease domain-containing protein [Planctomicrobium sp.]|nr:PDDEXK nuclease domain-containing protein [Planctomicrobium sp.]
MNQKSLPPQNTRTDFSQLAESIRAIDVQLKSNVAKAVNLSLTLRNWLIGFYIHEYEQHGNDRAQYGDRLLDSLADQLGKLDVSRSEARELRRYRLFYQTYPRIWETLTPEFRNLLPVNQLQVVTPIGESSSPKLNRNLLTRLSFSHISELLKCEDPQKRAYYEAECIRGSWTVRELKRQINSLLYERSGLSHDPKKLVRLTDQTAERESTGLTIRDPYIFEFLGLTSQEVMSESHLEHQLLDRLQNFLLELGQGFCFEARQRRILIGETYNFVDLVFYHRILKCHVLVELKLEAFSHENIGQLNTYVSWFNAHVRTEDDNPPVGILLCTEKDHALVKYALAGMDNALFVSRYQLELPSQETLQQQLEVERQRLEEAH